MGGLGLPCRPGAVSTVGGPPYLIGALRDAELAEHVQRAHGVVPAWEAGVASK